MQALRRKPDGSEIAERRKPTGRLRFQRLGKGRSQPNRQAGFRRHGGRRSPFRWRQLAKPPALRPDPGAADQTTCHVGERRVFQQVPVTNASLRRFSSPAWFLVRARHFAPVPQTGSASGFPAKEQPGSCASDSDGDQTPLRTQRLFLSLAMDHSRVKFARRSVVLLVGLRGAPSLPFSPPDGRSTR